METTLRRDQLEPFERRLAETNQETQQAYPGARADRQPVHTVYGGAHLFKSDIAPRLGKSALEALHRHAPTAEVLQRAVGMPHDVAETVYERVVAKLEREPVEDFRIDFEDGYGNRPDDEEDDHAVGVAALVAAGMAEGTLPPFIGIRVKPLSADLHHRSLRTLDLFLGSLLDATGGSLPDGFVVTLPKLTSPVHAEVFADVLQTHEEAAGLAAGSLHFEIMIETTQSIFDRDGTVAVRKQVDAGKGRCIAAHFGTYDYTAACDITAEQQRMGHPACDFARHVIQVALAGTGVWLSDGASNLLPVADPSDPAADDIVHAAWRLHYRDVQHSLSHAFYQGWDLHPAQLPSRYAAVYAFFLDGIDRAGDRLRNFIGTAARATTVGDVFDDAATGQGLLNFFLRAFNSGAITVQEAAARSGLTLPEIRTRSFRTILEGRAAP